MRFLTVLLVLATLLFLWQPADQGVEQSYSTLTTYYNGDPIQVEQNDYVVTIRDNKVVVNDGKVKDFDSKMARSNKDVMYFTGDSMVAEYRYRDREFWIYEQKERYRFNQ